MPDDQTTPTTPTNNVPTSALSAGLDAAPPPTPAGDPATPPKPTEPPGPTEPKTPEAPPPGAPEKYESWKVPEGYEIDATAMAEVEPLFKELNLTQDQAQKLIDVYSKHGVKTSEDAMKGWMEVRQGWRDEMLASEDLGKLVGTDGKFGPDSKLITTVNKALSTLDPKLVSDFKAAMDLTGAGDNPPIVRVLHAFASKLTEGTTYVRGEPANVNPKTGEVRPRPSAAAALYPNLPSAGNGAA